MKFQDVSGVDNTMKNRNEIQLPGKGRGCEIRRAFPKEVSFYKGRETIENIGL